MHTECGERSLIIGDKMMLLLLCLLENFSITKLGGSAYRGEGGFSFIGRHVIFFFIFLFGHHSDADDLDRIMEWQNYRRRTSLDS